MRNISRVVGARAHTDFDAGFSLLLRPVRVGIYVCDNMESAKVSAVVDLQGSQLTVKIPGVFMDKENLEVETV